MKTKEILLQARAAAEVIELFVQHDLPLNITKGQRIRTNDKEHTVLTKITIEYNPDDEQLVDWLLKKVEE